MPRFLENPGAEPRSGKSDAIVFMIGTGIGAGILSGGRVSAARTNSQVAQAGSPITEAKA